MGLEVTAHLEKRMFDRDFNEIDLRAMLEDQLAIVRMLSRDDG